MRVPMARWAHVVSDAEGPTKAAVQIQQDCRKPRTQMRTVAIAEVARLEGCYFGGFHGSHERCLAFDGMGV